MKTNNLVLITFSFGIIWLLQSCSSDTASADTMIQDKVKEPQAASLKLSAAQQQNLGLSTETIQQQAMGLTIFANGQIEVPPQNKSYISMPYGGYIKQIKVLDGMRVQKGQLLMTVEHPEIVSLQQT